MYINGNMYKQDVFEICINIQQQWKGATKQKTTL